MPTMPTIRVVAKRPGLPAEVVDIPNTLEGIKSQLDDACICGIRLNREVTGYCDDEGLLKELPLNFILHGEPIVGPVVFSKVNGEGEEIGFDDEAEALDLCQKLNGGRV